jgi:hypothetical protein
MGEVQGIYSKAGRLTLNMSAVVDLAYDKMKKCSSAYSVEATSASQAVIKFDTTKKIRLGQKLSSLYYAANAVNRMFSNKTYPSEWQT